MRRFSSCAKTPPAKMRGHNLPAGEVPGGNYEGFVKRPSQHQLTELETVGCDGHHVKTDPAGNRHQGDRELRRGHEGTPDSLHLINFPESETVCCDNHHNSGRYWTKVQLKESARRVRNEEQAVSLIPLVLQLTWPVTASNRCGPFVNAGEHDGFDESICPCLRPQEPRWRSLVA